MIAPADRPAKHRPEGLLLQWHVTDRCDLRCRHCYGEGKPAADLPFGALMGILDQFERLAARWRREAAPEAFRFHVTVTGGEPFVREDFPDLLEELAARRDRLSFAVLTNGTRIDAERARWLAGLRPGFVQLSLDGDRDTHDGIRGEGDFDRTVETLRRLVRAGVRTFVSFTAHRGNYREFPAVARVARRAGVARVWSDRQIPCGAGAALADRRMTPDETRELFALMQRERERAKRALFGRTEVAMHRALQFLVGDGAAYRCSAGDSLLTVLPRGGLVPCRRMPLEVGNVLETPLETLYEESPLLRDLRDRSRVATGCEGCACEPICGGGLRCLSDAVRGDPHTADPGCWLARSPTVAAPSRIQ